MQIAPFFWLHIKKSAGITTRKLLEPYFIEVDRNKKPKNFILAMPAEYNDILNNYRVVLGEYQFRRSLFAKTYLYPSQWGELFSFAFAREPVDRCVSMFYYLLYWRDARFIKNLRLAFKRSLYAEKWLFNVSYSFDVFLEYAQMARESDSIYQPLDLHFTTHTAPMWEDVTDLEGQVLLKKIFRLEYLTEGVNQVFEACGIEKRLETNTVCLKENKNKRLYTPTKDQIKKIEKIYLHDFELYENAEH